MKPAPAGWPRLSVSVFYKDPSKAIDWLCDAFGFECKVKIEEGGTVVHSQLTFGDGLVMVGGEASQRPNETHRKSPASIGGNITGAVMIFVDDCDEHAAHAKAHGAKVVRGPETNDYGADWWTDRSYEAVDLEGHHWYFVQRIRSAETQDKK